MENKNMSSSIKELAVNLSKAQAEFKIAEKNQKNPFFKSSYADWQAIVQASRPSLTKYGLSIVQSTINKEDGAYLMTILLHASGEWISSEAKINPPKQDIQAISSYRTYLKRMEYAALVGVVAGDEDDDGEAAVASTRQNYQSSYSYQTDEKITTEQLEQLEHELNDHIEIAEMVLKGLNIKTLRDMPKNKFLSSITRIRQIKDARGDK